MAAATGAGLALAAFLLLPFWEFMHRSFDVHKPENVGGAIPGLYHDPAGASLFTYEVHDLHLNRSMLMASIETPAVLILLMGAALVYFYRQQANANVFSKLGPALMLIVNAEMYLCFIGPVYSFYNRLPYLDHNPYQGASAMERRALSIFLMGSIPPFSIK